MRPHFVILALTTAIAVSIPSISFAETVAPAAPSIFAPGIVSSSANDGSPTFTPDGNTLVFTRSGTWGALMESHRERGRWSAPTMAQFSGRWNDSSPEFSPDGSYLVYVSIRPSGSRHVANLWRVDRIGRTWGIPQQLPASVNIGPSIWKPSIARSGAIYFVAIDAKGGKRLYRSARTRGAYKTAQPLAFSDGTTGDVDPEVAPDESYLIFSSDGRLAGDAKDHLFVTFKDGDTWRTPIPIHYRGDADNGYSSDDEPHVSGGLLYFSSDRTVPVQFPRSASQAHADLTRLEAWDNSNTNVWTLPLEGVLRLRQSIATAASPQPVPPTDPEAQQNEAGVRAVEAHWTQAFLHGDTAFLTRLLAPNYVSISTKGVVRDRAAIVGLAVAMSKKNLGSFPAQTLQVEVRGESAIVTSSDGGQRSVDVFYFSDGAWHAWYSQHTATS